VSAALRLAERIEEHADGIRALGLRQMNHTMDCSEARLLVAALRLAEATFTIWNNKDADYFECQAAELAAMDSFRAALKEVPDAE